MTRAERSFPTAFRLLAATSALVVLALLAPTAEAMLIVTEFAAKGFSPSTELIWIAGTEE